MSANIDQLLLVAQQAVVKATDVKMLEDIRLEYLGNY